MPRHKKTLVEPEITPEGTPEEEAAIQPEDVYEDAPGEEMQEQEPANILHMIPRGDQLASPLEEEEEEEPADPYGDLPQEEDGNDGEPAWTPLVVGGNHEPQETPLIEEPAPSEDLEEEEEETPLLLLPQETFKGALVWANLRDAAMDAFFVLALDAHATIALDLRRRKGEKVPSTPPERMPLLSPAALRRRYGHKVLDMSASLGDGDDANPHPHEFQVDPEKALRIIHRYLSIGYHVILFETCAQEPTLSLALAEMFRLHHPDVALLSMQEFVERQ